MQLKHVLISRAVDETASEAEQREAYDTSEERRIGYFDGTAIARG